MDLVTHLMDWYGNITPRNLKDNKNKIEEQNITNSTINVYFNRINNAIHFLADRKTSYTSNKILQTVYHATMATGLYINKTIEWHWNVASENTWTKFKKFFSKAYY